MSANTQQVQDVQKLFLKHSSLLRGFVLGLFPSFDMADDVLQEVFVVVTEKADAYRPGTNFTAWACEIAKRKCLEYSRKHRQKSGVLCSEAIERLCAVAPDLPEEPDDEHLALEDCVDKLAPKTKKIIKMRYRQGIKPGKIARKLSWTPQAVYVALSRARSYLRTCMDRKMAGEGA